MESRKRRNREIYERKGRNEKTRDNTHHVTHTDENGTCKNYDVSMRKKNRMTEEVSVLNQRGRMGVSMKVRESGGVRHGIFIRQRSMEAKVTTDVGRVYQGPTTFNLAFTVHIFQRWELSHVERELLFDHLNGDGNKHLQELPWRENEEEEEKRRENEKKLKQK